MIKISATIENETKRVVKEVEPDVSMKEITKKKQEVQGEKDDHEKRALLRIILSAIGLLILFLWSPAEPIKFIGFLLIDCKSLDLISSNGQSGT